MAETEDGGRIPTVLRLLRVIEVLAEEGRPLTATEINAHLGLPKQSVHRLCGTLAAEGFLSHDGEGGGLRPGRRLRALAAGVLHASAFHVARRQILAGLARQVGETVNYVVPGETGMVYRDRIETDWALRIQLPVGSAVPFHCTASGKTFLASLPPPRRRALVRGLSLERHTPGTLTSPAALEAELERIAEQGHAVDAEEFMEGMVALAMPVRDAEGRFVAAVAFHGPVPRLTVESALTLRPVLAETALRLGEALGA